MERRVRDHYEQRFEKLASEADIDEPAKVESVECDGSRCTVRVDGRASTLDVTVRVGPDGAMSETGSSVVAR